MEIARLATLVSALLIAGCDFGIDTKGLVGDGSIPDVAQSDAPSDSAPSDAGSDAVAEAGATTLLGDTKAESTSVTVAASTPDGFRFQASASGSAKTVWVYVDSQSSGAAFDVGLYDDDATTTPAQPKNLLAQATFSSPSPGGWSSQALPATTITSGAYYWIVVNVTSGTLYYRIAGGTSGSLESVSATSPLLPTSWSTSKTAMDGPASMYVTN